MIKYFELRPIIFYSLLFCLAVALAPWMTGGREPLAMMLSSSALLLGLLLLWLQPEAPIIGLKAPRWIFLGFLGWGALSLIWSVDRYSTVQWLYLWWSVPVVFYLAYVIAACQNGRQWLLRLYLVSASLFCLHGVWLYFASSYDRLTGSFYWPNLAAAYLLPAVVICASRVGETIKWKTWWLALVGFGTVFALTDSRAAILVITFLFIILLFSRRDKWYWIKIVFAIAAIVIVSSTAALLVSKISSGHQAKTFGSRYSAAGVGESTSFGDRLKYLESAALMVSESPFFGFGAGTYRDAHPLYQVGVTDASANAHNLYAQTAAELGLVGIVILVVGLACYYFTIRKNLFTKSNLAISLSVVGLLAHFGLDFDAVHPALLWLAVLFTAILCSQNGIFSNRKISRSWLVVAQLLICVASFSVYHGEIFVSKAEAAQQDGDYVAAAELYGVANDWVIGNPDWLVREGAVRLALAERGDSEDINMALELARSGQQMDRLDAQPWQLEGRVEAARGRLSEAEIAFRRAISRDANNRPEYYSDLVSVLYTQKKMAEAVKVADVLLSKYSEKVVANRSADSSLKPALANLWGMTGQAYLVSHNIEKAKFCADQAIKLYPQSLRGRALQNQIKKQ